MKTLTNICEWIIRQLIDEDLENRILEAHIMNTKLAKENLQRKYNSLKNGHLN